MDTVTNRVITVDDTGGWGTNTAANVIPVDSSMYFAATAARTGSGNGPSTPATGGISGTGDRDAIHGYFYKLEANNFINKYHVNVAIDVTTTTSGTPPVTTTDFVLSYSSHIDNFPCYYNFAHQHVSGTTDSTDYTFVKTTSTVITNVDNFRDPVLYNSTNPASYDNKVASGGISDEDFDGRAADFTANTVTSEGALTQFRTDFGNSSRGTPWTAPSGVTTPTGSSVNFASLTGSINGVTRWESLRTSCAALGTACAQRVIELDARIGVPVYANSTGSGTTAATRGNPPCIRVRTIPTANDPIPLVPYGRAIYDNVNLLLGQDVDLLGGIIKDVESLTDLVQLVKNARNKYEIYNGRPKGY